MQTCYLFWPCVIPYALPVSSLSDVVGLLVDSSRNSENMYYIQHYNHLHKSLWSLI